MAISRASRILPAPSNDAPTSSSWHRQTQHFWHLWRSSCARATPGGFVCHKRLRTPCGWFAFQVCYSALWEYFIQQDTLVNFSNRQRHGGLDLAPWHRRYFVDKLKTTFCTLCILSPWIECWHAWQIWQFSLACHIKQELTTLSMNKSLW